MKIFLWPARGYILTKLMFDSMNYSSKSVVVVRLNLDSARLSLSYSSVRPDIFHVTCDIFNEVTQFVSGSLP